MKFYFTFLFVVIQFVSSAQQFTRGTIFNYSVGDTIIERYSYFSGGQQGKFSVKLRAVIGKTVNVTGDTIWYRESRITDTIFGYSGNFQFVLVQETLDYINTNLQYVMSSEVVVGPNNLCLTQSDVGYTDTCGFKVHKKSLQRKSPLNSCFEPPSLTRYYIEGVGVYQYTLSLNFPPNVGHNSDILFVHKVGQNDCGARVQLTTGLKEFLAQSNVLQVYPNPVIGDILELKTAEKLQLEIYSLDGRKLSEQSAPSGDKTIDMTTFQNGVYFLRYTNGIHSGQKKLIVNRTNQL